MKPHFRIAIMTLFIAIIAAWFVSWSVTISSNLNGSGSGPDERLRMLVPTYIYHHHSLPNGYDPEVIYDTGNWSYAFYPQFLGAIVSAAFMGIVGVFNNSSDTLIHGARLASVLFGMVTVIIFGLTVRKLLEGQRHATAYSYFGMTLLAFWPQFAFLSAYVNNDIVALSGVSLIVYASVLGLKDKWNMKNAVLLGFGFTICLLGYINSWGFVLCGALLFLVTFFRQNSGVSLNRNLKLFIGTCLVPLLLAGPFFIRNALLYNGDFLGLKTFGERTVAWEVANNSAVQISYLESGRSALHLLHDPVYWTSVGESFIGKFGYMTISPSDSLLFVYKGLVILGSIGFILLIVIAINRRGRGQYGIHLLLWASLVCASIITLGLSLYYTLKIDVQSQGRYIIYLLVPLLLTSTLGIKKIADIATPKKYWLVVPAIIITFYVLNSLIIFKDYVA